MQIKTNIIFVNGQNAKENLELKDVVSIAGKPGLNVIVGKRTNGLIVETIDVQKKRFPTTLNQRVSILEDISIYTKEGDVKLIEVLRTLHKESANGLEMVTKKNSGDEIRTFFRKIVPDFDEAQVYNSDIVKVAGWYLILKDHVNLDAEADSNKESDVVESNVAKSPITAKPKIGKSAGPTGKTKGVQAKAPKSNQRKMS